MKQVAFPLALALTIAAVPLGAQNEEEESGGLLVDFLEDTLSGDGQYLKVRGLTGALSSKATIEQITIADDEGVWLTINNAALDWNRLALIRGRFSVNALTAGEIRIDRAPHPTATAQPAPTPEAQPFQVPELPVAIELGEIRVNTLALGEPLIGLSAELEVLGKLTLADGALDTDLGITRLDRPGDAIKLVAAFENESSQIGLDLQVIEDQGGLISTALQMPGQPALLLTAKGAGPVTDFTADIALSSEDAERVAGQVQLQGVPAADASDRTAIAFTADLGGDVTPFLEPEFDPFFGTNTLLHLSGRSDPDGALHVPEFRINSEALRLKGELALTASGQLDKVALQGRITPPDGNSVVLPVADPRVTLEAAQISGLLDRSIGNQWILSITADGLETPDVRLGAAKLSAQGILNQEETLTLEGDLQAALDGLVFADPALNKAVGQNIQLDGFFDLLDAGQLQLTDVQLTGGDYSAQADAAIKGLNSGFEVDGAVTVTATDLARFSDLAEQDLSGAVKAQLNGTGAPLGGSFDFTLDIEGQSLATGMAEIDPLITGKTAIHIDAVRDGDGLRMRKFTLDAAAAQIEAAANLSGLGGDLALDGTVSVDTPDLALFSGLARQDLSGRAKARFDGRSTLSGDSFDFNLDVSGQNLAAGMAEIDPLIAGTTTITLSATRTGERLSLRQLQVNADAVQTDVAAEITGLPADLGGDLMANLAVESSKARLAAPDLSLFSGLAGMDLAGHVRADLAGSATLATQDFNLQLDLDAQDLRAGIEQLDKLIEGHTTLVMDAAKSGEAIDIRRFDLNGSALTAQAQGALQPGSDGTLTFSAALDELNRITPTLSGPLTLNGDVAQTASGLKADVTLNGPDSSYAKLAGTIDADGGADLTFDAELSRLERFVPNFAGAVSAKGTASRAQSVWSIDATATGPGNLNAEVAGGFDESEGTADLTGKGTLNLGLANSFISPNAIEGTAQFDLALNGKPGLEALSGTISTSGTSVAVPAAGQTVTGIGGVVQIANQKAAISINGGLPAGGGFTVSGPVALSPPFNGQIALALNDLILTDNILFETTANGQITMSGPLAGNSAVVGMIVFGETNINLAAASGAVGAAPIPEIAHVGEPRAAFVTRERANLVQTETASDSKGPIIALDVSLQAPNKVFARGRGLNAELGGEIHIGGTSAALTPSGQIELIRGTFDILAQRLELTRGLVALQGNLTAFVEFESTATTDEGQATLEIAGPLDAPEIKVYSDPERPSEEALAMLLFGTEFSNLSPFVIAQMAASLAQLSGAGGDQTKGLRNSTGASTVDIGTDSGGAGRLGAGAYLGENLYTDFNVNTAGETEVNLNLDVTDNFTVKGTVDNAGDTSVGLFFERDY